MQTLLEQLKMVSPERADVLMHKGRLSRSRLLRSLQALDVTPYCGKHSSQANLFLLLRALNQTPRLKGASWPGALHIYPRTDKIGEGSFAIVYKCGALALKQLKKPHTSLSEVQIMRSLSHPGIVQLRDHWYEGGCLIILTALAPGRPLRAQLPLPLGECLSAGAQLFSALAHMHGLNVVHRDIKPANVQWDSLSQHLTLLDLGLAHRTQSAQSASSWRGTMAYSLAEAWRQRGDAPQNLLERNDVWACWATLWAACTGAGPYKVIRNLDELKELMVRSDAEIVQRMGWGVQPCAWVTLQLALCDMSRQPSAAQAMQLVKTTGLCKT
jgi:serine/threonine protein kinase